MTIKRALIGLFLLFLIAAICLAGWWAYTTREREFSGTYSGGFESSLFVESDALGNNAELTDDNHGWLTFGSTTLPPHPCEEALLSSDGAWTSTSYRITFRGKRVPGPSGHLSLYPAEYFVTAILKAEPILSACSREGEPSQIDQ